MIVTANYPAPPLASLWDLACEVNQLRGGRAAPGSENDAYAGKETVTYRAWNGRKTITARLTHPEWRKLQDYLL